MALKCEFPSKCHYHSRRSAQKRVPRKMFCWTKNDWLAFLLQFHILPTFCLLCWTKICKWYFSRVKRKTSCGHKSMQVPLLRKTFPSRRTKFKVLSQAMSIKEVYFPPKFSCRLRGPQDVPSRGILRARKKVELSGSRLLRRPQSAFVFRWK